MSRRRGGRGLSKGARTALGRLYEGRFHNASSNALGELIDLGLCDEAGVITKAGQDRAGSALSRAVEHFHRTRHVGGVGLPKRLQRRPESGAL